VKNSRQITLALGVLVLALVVGLGRKWTVSAAATDKMQIAVASNFADAITELAERFTAETGHEVALSFGSTGKHYAQITNGAPYDAFFAADVRRPELLEQEGRAVPGSRFTYAVGRLVLWSPKGGLVDGEGEVLKSAEIRHLAIANPELAPYGEAARQVLVARDLWDSLEGRLVRGENIGQTYQFVVTGNAELGFVAGSQVKSPGHPAGGSQWDVPQELHAPIEQQAVLLRDTEPARAFLEFVRSKASRELIHEYGYGTP